MVKQLTNVLGFDDAPFARHHRGDVALIGTICSRTRLDGVVCGKVRRDGTNSTRVMAELLRQSQFLGHVRAVILQGIAVAGFNVVDIHGLSEDLGLPVLVVARRQPRLPSLKHALLNNVPGGAKKWALIQKAGKMEPLRGLFIQRVGMTRTDAAQLLAATTLHGNLPEAVRLAHIIAGGVTDGSSRGRA